jgi:transposase
VVETAEDAGMVARVAALDVGKAELTACVRVPHEDKPGRRLQEVRTFATATPALLGLRDWLVCQGVALCVMEAASTYWKPPFYLLEDAVECWVVNAGGRQERAGPGEDGQAGCDLAGRAGDAARVVGAAAVAASAAGPVPVPADPGPGADPGEAAGSEAAEDTQIKLPAVISDIFGKSGRDMPRR